mgnify:CR=1 FL=1
MIFTCSYFLSRRKTSRSDENKKSREWRRNDGGFVNKKYMRQKIFDILDSLEISYTNYEHTPVFTCDEAK